MDNELATTERVQDAQRLQELAARVLELAKARGASQAEVAINEDSGLAVNVRMSTRSRRASSSSSVCLSVAAIAAGSRCAPPRGSGTMRSISLCSSSRGAVRPNASAASRALSALFHKIEAQPSGEITE